MPRTLVSSEAVPPPAGPYSPALDVDGWVFLAGQGGPGETIEEQTDAALANVAALLDAAGCSFDDVVSTLVHLSDLSDFKRYNAVYERHFAEPRPVRTTVGASLLGSMLVEITVVARRPD
jgi:2-iminobutanoate/2-iminopropanoate deaminase